MEELTIALFPFDIEWENPPANRKTIEAALETNNKAFDLLVLPEMFASGFSMHPERFAEPMNGSTVTWMKSIARTHRAAVTGSLAIQTETGYANRMLFVLPDGVIHHYDKRHLFTYSGEDKVFQKGNERTFIRMGKWRVFPQVCYDLRFPVFARNDIGYDLAIYVANWPDTRILHWDTLLKARAIENQAYTLGLNRVGTDGNGLHYNGQSTVTSFDGSQILNTDKATGLHFATLSYSDQAAYREKYPFLKDRDHFAID
jgi:omega-amidase